MISLDNVTPGSTCIIRSVGGGGALRTRMMDMGLLKGTEIKVVRLAPLGDPIEFEVKGYNLSLRKKEARLVEVEVLADAT
ncbi:MAG: ferrous iron transport protein A [Chloroflexi bacterium]|jgi:ferrous iron transport protein A|nr:ferrous iron transport protein A [Chloroflexota bacterium]